MTISKLTKNNMKDDTNIDYSEVIKELEKCADLENNPHVFYDGLGEDGCSAQDKDEVMTLNVINKYLKDVKVKGIDGLISRVRKEMPMLKAIEEHIRNKKPEIRIRVKLKEKERKERKAARMEDIEESESEDEAINAEIVPHPEHMNYSFADLHLCHTLCKVVGGMGFTKPTPIQVMAIPQALRGRDILACASTGTGKTAAFGLPIMQRFWMRPPSAQKHIAVLILVPTRELAMQVYEQMMHMGRESKLTMSLVVGGMDSKQQVSELQKKPDVVVATPGRLLDLLKRSSSVMTLAKVEVFVVDEADRMLDEFFADDLAAIVQKCNANRQVMLFSATLTDKVKDLAKLSLKKPVKIYANSNKDVAKNLVQEFVRLKSKKDDQRILSLMYLVSNMYRQSTMVFLATKVQCHEMYILFSLMNIPCAELHSKLSQAMRIKNLFDFKMGKVKVLFTTDIAARGLDIKGVKTVINYFVPKTYALYIHRVGRTARAGFHGRAITIAQDKGLDYSQLRRIAKHSLKPLSEVIIKHNSLDQLRKMLPALRKAQNEVLAKEEEEERTGTVGKLENILHTMKAKRKEDKEKQSEEDTEKQSEIIKASSQDDNKETDEQSIVVKAAEIAAKEAAAEKATKEKAEAIRLLSDIFEESAVSKTRQKFVVKARQEEEVAAKKQAQIDQKARKQEKKKKKKVEVPTTGPKPMRKVERKALFRDENLLRDFVAGRIEMKDIANIRKVSKQVENKRENHEASTERKHRADRKAKLNKTEENDNKQNGKDEFKKKRGASVFSEDVWSKEESRRELKRRMFLEARGEVLQEEEEKLHERINDRIEQSSNDKAKNKATKLKRKIKKLKKK